MSFYEMAVGNLHFVAAAVILLMAIVHVASNAIAWYDMSVTVKKSKKSQQEDAAEQPAPAEK